MRAVHDLGEKLPAFRLDPLDVDADLVRDAYQILHLHPPKLFEVVRHELVGAERREAREDLTHIDRRSRRLGQPFPASSVMLFAENSARTSGSAASWSESAFAGFSSRSLSSVSTLLAVS